jgi:hypothetical protein
MPIGIRARPSARFYCAETDDAVGPLPSKAPVWNALAKTRLVPVYFVAHPAGACSFSPSPLLASPSLLPGKFDSSSLHAYGWALRHSFASLNIFALFVKQALHSRSRF